MDEKRDPRRDLPAARHRREWSSELLTGKVFDVGGNAVGARLLVWGPEDVGGEMCLMVKPTDFDPAGCAPDPNYDLRRRPRIAPDDLQLAIPLRLAGAEDQWVDIAGLSTDEAERVTLAARAERYPLAGEYLFNFRVAVVSTVAPVTGRPESEQAERFLRDLLPVRELVDRGAWRAIVTDIEPMRSPRQPAERPGLDSAALRRAAIVAISGERVGRGALLALLESAGIDPANA